MKLESNDGLPWTASTGLGWIVLLVALTCGIGFWALSIYLALWIYSKGRSVFPLVGFVIAFFIEIPGVLIWGTANRWLDYAGVFATLLLIAATFSMRHEIQEHFRRTEGWNVIMSPGLTFFFSTLYINYALNPVILQRRSDMTSLNLSSGVSAKIEQ